MPASAARVKGRRPGNAVTGKISRFLARRPTHPHPRARYPFQVVDAATQRQFPPIPRGPESPAGLVAEATDRSTLPIASDNLQAATQAIGLINQLGFDAVNTGTLSQSWRFEPDAAAYTRLYLADPSTPDQQLMEAAGAPVTEEKLQSALAHGTRVDVAARAF